MRKHAKQRACLCEYFHPYENFLEVSLYLFEVHHEHFRVVGEERFCFQPRQQLFEPLHAVSCGNLTDLKLIYIKFRVHKKARNALG